MARSRADEINAHGAFALAEAMAMAEDAIRAVLAYRRDHGIISYG
jgi:hypothetical protein